MSRSPPNNIRRYSPQRPVHGHGHSPLIGIGSPPPPPHPGSGVRRSPAVRRDQSRSPIRDAIPLVVDSDSDSDDDDDDDENDELNAMTMGIGIGIDITGTSARQQPQPQPPSLASTYSSSDGGGNDNDHNHAIIMEGNNNSNSNNSTPKIATLTHEAVAVLNRSNDSRNNGGRGRMITESSSSPVMRLDYPQSSPGIGKWSRRDIRIATDSNERRRSSFSPIQSNGSNNNSNNNSNNSSNIYHPNNRNKSNQYNQYNQYNNNNSYNNHHNDNKHSTTYNNSKHHGTNNSYSNSIPITPLHQIPYVHGGYAAAAPLFVTHSKFASILKKLLPGAYEELSVLLRNSDFTKTNHRVTKRSNNGDSSHMNITTKRSNSSSGSCSGGNNNNNNKKSNSSGLSCNGSWTQQEKQKSRVDRLTSCSPVNHHDVIKESNSGSDGGSPTPPPTTTTTDYSSVDVILPDPVKVMKWAENNPVVSAFGIWYSDSGRRTIKFMQGINLCHTNDLRDNAKDEEFDYRDGEYHSRQQQHHPNVGIFNDWNDRESVVTIGSNYNSFGGSQVGGHGSGFGRRNVNNNNNHHFARPKRRKQPLPEDVPAAASDSDGLYPMEVPPPSYNKPALEWDVFLDPNVVRQVDAAMSVVDSLESKLRKARMKRERRMAARKLSPIKVTTAKSIMRKQNQFGNKSSSSNIDNESNGNNDDSDDEDSDNDDFDILQSHTAAQVEVDRLVSQLMRRTIIAHGSMSQLVLEAVGVAPKYNFGTVVRASREQTAISNHVATSPSRSMKRVSLKAGNREFSVNMTQTIGVEHTSSWDEEEEQHDFEALLDPTILDNDNGKSREKQRKKASTSTGSKGMFMETWIHAFSRTLSLLVKSSNGANNGVTSNNSGNSVKKSSSNGSSRSNSSNNGGRLLVKNRPAHIGQRGLSGLLEKMFMRRDSSIGVNDAVGNNRQQSLGTEVARSFDADNNHGRRHNNHNMDYEEDDSELLTNNDMFASPQTPTASSVFSAGLCGMSLCLGYEDTSNTGTSTFPLNPHASHKMAQDIESISSVLGEPLRLVLDLKSRRVPPRVWSRLIDSMRTRGLIIEGIGSFDYDELRVIGKGCSYPLCPILFFHSVGDLQRACHANEVKNGDTVYFNGGSLMWKRSSIMEAAERGCCGAIETDVGGGYEHDTTGDGVTRSSTAKVISGGGGNYSFQPYAYPQSALSDWERSMCKSTIEDYRRHFNLKIGVYVQEFSISAEALDALSVFVNKHGDIYDQGLAFGGVNGTAVKNIHGDGYWNQRYMGRSWDFDARPSREMTPLKPEDHHLVQKAIQAGAWGQVGTIYEVMDEKAGALTVPQPREPCNMVNTSFL